MLQKLLLSILLVLAFMPEAKPQSQSSSAYKKAGETPMMMPQNGYFQYSRRPKEQYVVCIPLERIDGHAIRKEIGSYPDTAKRLQLEGDVLVKIIVNSQGKVIQANAVKGLAVFRLASEQAAKKWLYSPSFAVEQCGCDTKVQPVELTGTILFRYRLNN